MAIGGLPSGGTRKIAAKFSEPADLDFLDDFLLPSALTREKIALAAKVLIEFAKKNVPAKVPSRICIILQLKRRI